MELTEKLTGLLGNLAGEINKEPDEWNRDAIVAAAGAVKGYLADRPAAEEREADIKTLRIEFDQLRKDLDTAHEQLKEYARTRLMASPIVPGEFHGRGRPRMRLSHPDLAREFAEFARKVGTNDKALTPSSDAEGAYTIPSHISEEIHRMVETVGVLDAVAGFVPLPGGTLKLIRRLSGAQMYWKAPGAEATESTPTFGQLEMSAETLIGLVESYLEFDEDSLVDTGNFLAMEFAYGIASEEDRCGFVGTGIGADGGITGVLNSTYVTIVDMAATETSFEDLTFDHLADLESNVWEEGLDEAQFLWHRTIKAVVKKIKDSAGLPVWQPAAGGEPSEVMGYPHRVSGKMRALASDAVSTTFAAFGNFRRGLLVGRRGALQMANSNEAGFKTLSRFWRCHERIDIAVMGFTAAEIAAHPELVNPLAVLKTASA